ncbi:metalloregulator ArsR/SmtB family transcription factor [Streptomyces sp. SL13]|uniref:Metalloregulator ArsR/SmtB family transcription factor n=1 Tax=Streptantibioticus silvisoli TaxID=2705255 RepID=A0AA90H5X8_9ACTN|nr:metalloregulator ArsR/SmtB family transcription factor [Streptantibioticus silvisoli]MDI5971485.1 metalloregulator ArsR/SmtB family transcription factor [Streptantibioticus silvisoli]
MNAEEHTPGIDAVLAALADPTRRRLLDALAEQGRASATTLAGGLPVSRQAVVKHLRVLVDADLVAGERAGREVLYRVHPQPLDASARWMANLAAAWDRRLTALKRSAEEPADSVGTGTGTGTAGAGEEADEPEDD